jgi:hypothetical protein
VPVVSTDFAAASPLTLGTMARRTIRWASPRAPWRRDIINRMSGTTDASSTPSGRFVLRLPPGLHEALRAEAAQAGLSLNEYCVRVLSAPGPDPTGPAAAVAARAAEAFGSDLVGVILYGSWARGEATAASDVDVLVVLEPTRAITRALYRDWDEVAMAHLGHPIEVHFVALPEQDHAGGVWLEAALDGVVVRDSDARVARLLGTLRRAMATGAVTLRHAHGQPYWTGAA